MPKRRRFAAFDLKQVRAMTEDAKLDAVAAILKLLSERTIKICFASGRQSGGHLTLKQRRAEHRKLFRSALRHIRAIDPALLRDLGGSEPNGGMSRDRGTSHR